MDLIDCNGFDLFGVESYNVLLGKNGCGKSFLLKAVERHIQGREGFGKVHYISPERAGFLVYEAGIEQNIANDINWMLGSRRRNQTENFKQQSLAQFKQLELRFLRLIEKEQSEPGYLPRTFDSVVDQLNSLLDRVRLERDNTKGFVILDKATDQPSAPQDISSGESELISLGIEFLAFASALPDDKVNILLVDEPDVHLHPDLQDRLAKFTISAFSEKPVTLLLATHSTALLAGLAEGADIRVAFMRSNDRSLTFKSVSEVDRKILPIFGAHPLSNVFNKAPVLLVEGEDDERIWQQAVRSANGRIRVFPCVVDGVDRFSEFETEVNNVIEAVYDDARAYSLRDRDTNPEAIDDFGHVRRMRLACRTAENMMLSDEVLASMNLDWAQMQAHIQGWAETNKNHQYYQAVQDFIDAGLPRKDHDLKDIRNILVGLGSNKPWEVLVGRAIAALSAVNNPAYTPDSLASYLGQRACQAILGLAA